MTKKEMQQKVELLCEGQTVRFGKYQIKAHEVKGDEIQCKMCTAHDICNIQFVECCTKCDGKTYTGHYFEIVGYEM